MGHFLFIVLHIAAVLFGIVGLIVTIPLHLVYSAVAGNSEKQKSELQKWADDWKAVEAKRPRAVRSGKRSMTQKEVVAEIKANPGIYFSTVFTLVGTTAVMIWLFT